MRQGRLEHALRGGFVPRRKNKEPPAQVRMVAADAAAAVAGSWWAVGAQAAAVAGWRSIDSGSSLMVVSGLSTVAGGQLTAVGGRLVAPQARQWFFFLNPKAGLEGGEVVGPQLGPHSGVGSG